MGIDFAGGVIIEAKATGVVDATALQSNLTNTGLLDPSKCRASAAQMTCFSYFQNTQGTPEQQQAALRSTRDAVERRCRGRRSAEWKWSGLLGRRRDAGQRPLGVSSSAAMFAYITFRFEWPFAAGAIATMFLDLTKTIGFLVITGFEFN